MTRTGSCFVRGPFATRQPQSAPLHPTLPLRAALSAARLRPTGPTGVCEEFVQSRNWSGSARLSVQRQLEERSCKRPLRSNTDRATPPENPGCLSNWAERRRRGRGTGAREQAGGRRRHLLPLSSSGMKNGSSAETVCKAQCGWRHCFGSCCETAVVHVELARIVSGVPCARAAADAPAFELVLDLCRSAHEHRIRFRADTGP